MSRLLLHRHALLSIAMFFCVFISAPTHAEELMVSAAASLSDAFKAIGNPASVPAGRYAREATDAAGMTETLKDRFIYAGSVRQVLAYVARAEVDAGFVYRTDALIDKGRVKIALEIPTKTPVIYPIAQVAAARHPLLAREFIAYLSTAPAHAVLSRYGFQRP